MALTLNDLKPEDNNLTIEDFKSEEPKGPKINERTAAQLSATDTLLSTGSVENYRETKDKLLDPQSRQDFILNQQRLRDLIWEDSQKTLVDTLSSPTVSDQEKISYLSASKITVDKLPPISTLDTLAEQAAIADSGVNETDRAAASRYDFLGDIRRVNNQKRQLTTMINSLEIGKDDTKLKKLKDVSELMAPFAEWIHYEDLAKEFTGDKTNLLGNYKRKLYEKIKEIPIDKREEFARTVMEIVQDSDTVVLPDGNDLVAVETLNRMLVNNDYSNAERWFDNVTSVLDVIGAGSILRGMAKGGKAAKGLKAASKAPTLAEEAAAFKARPKQPVSPLEQEAKDFTPSKEPTADEVFAPKPKLDNSPDKLADEAKNFKPEPEPTADTLFRGALKESTRTEVVPSSPSQVVKDVNPELAREMHRMAAEDETGEAAKALYGASREEAIAKDLLPEPDIGTGKIPNKVEMRRPEYEEPKDLKEARLANGNTAVSDSEMAKVRQKVVTSLEDVEGMVLHPSSLIVRTNPDSTINIMARYSPLDSGFSSPSEALDNAQYAFRHYGISPDSFTVLARNGDEWVPTSLSDLSAKEILKKSRPGIENDVPQLKDVDYAIGLDYNYRFKPEDLTEVDLLTTAPGLIARTVQMIDRIPSQMFASAGQGSIVQHLLDAASVIHPQIVNAASVAVDRAYGIKKLLVDEFKAFTDVYKKFPKERRALLTDYINEANRDGLKLDVADLYNRGFSEKEIESLKQWRRANDAAWHMTNADTVKTLRSRGSKVFTHKGNDIRLIGRPVEKRAITSQDVIYDPVSNTRVGVDAQQINKLYEDGGQMFRLDQPIQVDGEWVDLVISRNTPDAGYVREIYDGETVLAYRDGYYPAMYDANYFITKTIKVNGKDTQKVIAAARDRNEVNKALQMLQSAEPDSKFTFRADRSVSEYDGKLFDEGTWSLSSSAGLTTQRFRGERLADAGSDLNRFGTAHLKDPLEAVNKQIHQLSQRVAMRTYMDTVKQRWMVNYGDYVELPRNPRTGKLEMPASPSQIKGKAGAPSKLVADARSNYNYIYSLENGYINYIDKAYKGAMHAFANFLGEKGWNKAERLAFEQVKSNPSQAAKTVAFKLFLSASPVRQALIQRGQITMLGSINPTYLAKDLAKDLFNLRLAMHGLTKDPKYLALYEEVRKSGVLEAVDAHNLIRDDMMRLADVTNWQKTKTAAGAPLRFTQKYGFDLAEQDNLLASWLAHRDLALKAGKDISNQRIKDEILGQSRAFTLNMNRAGEMPYSHNTLGLFAQFLSFRHKAFLQPFTNRSLSGMDRAKLLAYTTILFGTDATLVSLAVDQAFDKSAPTETKDKIRDGLLDLTLNSVLSAVSGEKQAIDWGDLAPVEAYGMWNVITGMYSTNLGDIVANSPAGSLVFGNNPRITDAFRTAMRYFNVLEDYQDPELQTTFRDVVKASASTFSGMSAMFKARYAYETKQKLSAYGRLTDEDVTGVEATMAAFGFRTKTETGYQDLKEILYGDRSFENDDVKAWYIELKRQLSRRGERTIENDMQQRILAEAWRVFNTDRPRALDIINKEIEKDAQSGDYTAFKAITSRMGLVPEDEIWKMINAMPDNQTRENLATTMKTMKEMLNGD